jgi:hypothetical protein
MLSSEKDVNSDVRGEAIVLLLLDDALHEADDGYVSYESALSVRKRVA